MIQVAVIVESSKLVSTLIFPMMLRTKSRKEIENIISRRIERVLNKTSNKLLLRGLGLKSIPESVKQLSSLSNFRSLNLQDNQIDDLPDWIGEFTSLYSLNLRNNRCSILPTTIWQLTKLQMLDLSDNLIFDISDSLRELSNLQTIYLHANRLRRLPLTINDLTQLQKLHISDNLLNKDSSLDSLRKSIKIFR
jgi:Leucine-rich repeat (LRR) protein